MDEKEILVESHGDKYSTTCPHCGEVEEFRRVRKSNEVIHTCKDKKHVLLTELYYEGQDYPNTTFFKKCDKCNFREEGSPAELKKFKKCPCCKKKLELYALRRPPEEYPTE